MPEPEVPDSTAPDDPPPDVTADQTGAPAPDPALGVATQDVPAGGPAEAPYLLVMPATEAARANVGWPQGQPAWAIPVAIPAGTRGYAIFLPMVQAAGEAVPQPTAAAALQQVATNQPAGTVQPAAALQPAGTNQPAATHQPAGTSQPAGAVEPGVPPAPGRGVIQGSPSAVGTPGTVPSVGVQSGPAAPAGAAPASAAQPPGPPPAMAPPVMGPPVILAPPVAPPVMQQRVGPPWPASGAAPQPYPLLVPIPVRVRDSFLKKRWPGPAQGHGWAVPLAVLVGALGLAVFLPLGRTGIGWLLSGAALVTGVVAAVWRAAAAQPRVERWIRAGWGVSALALLSVLAFRNAWWLVTFCVLGALGCAALAIVGGRLVRSILYSLVAAPFAAFRGLPWVGRHVADRSRLRAGTGSRIGWSVAVTALVLLVFGALLSSADAAFSVVLADLVPQIGAGTVVGWIFLLAVGGLVAAAAVYTISAPPDLSTVDSPARRGLSGVDWALPIGALVLLFGGFVAVQFTVLFGGQRHVLQTAGLNYADYARSGFWQLLTVTLLTLAVLGGVSRWARRDRPADRLWLRILLGLLCALSIVIVISALSRMYTYQKVYSFTGERIFIMAFELLLGTVFLLVMAAGVRLRGGWIPRVTVALGVLLLLALAVLNPEEYVARRNIARYQETGKIDAWYLRALSADATPALAELPDAVRRCTLSWIADDLDDPDPWYAWNLGRSRARDALKQLGPDAIGGPLDCRAADQFDLPKTR